MKARPKGPQKGANLKKYGGRKRQIKPVTNAVLQRYVKIILMIGKTSFSTLSHETKVREKYGW